MSGQLCALLWLLGVLAAAGCGASLPPAAVPSGAQVVLTGAQLHALAQDLERRGDYVRSEQYALSAMQRGVPRRRILPLLLHVCVRAARYSAALAHAEPELSVSPQDHALRLLVATLNAALDRRAEALRQVRQVLATLPTEPRALALQRELEATEP